MDLALLVYGISMLNGISAVVGITLFTLLLAAIIAGIHFCTWRFSATEYSWDLNRDGTLKTKVAEGRLLSVKILKYSTIGVFVFSLFAILIPSERTAYMILGAYATQKVAQDPKAQEVGEKIMKIANAKLDEYVEDAMKVTKKKER